jgi:hypothetical protein
MIDANAVPEIIKQYEKHGWTLRRALLSEEGRNAVGDSLGDIDISPSDLDALWFSRRSNPDSEAWELRRLAGLPFALVAVVSSDASSEEVESTLDQVVDDMRERRMA